MYQSGSVDGSSFIGSPLYYDVTFSYNVNVDSIIPRDWSISNKTSTGFRINSNSSASFTHSVDWSALESSNTTIGAFIGPTGPQGPAGPQGPTGPQSLPDGSLSSPGLSFINSPNTGIYRNPNQLGFSVNGADVGRFVTNSGVASFAPMDGTVARPGVSFYGDLDTGMWRPGTNRLGLAAGGATAAIFGTTNSIATRTYFERGVHHYPVINTSVSGTYQVDMAAGNIFNLTLTGNATISTTNSSIGSYFLYIRQDATGGRTLQMHNDGRFLGTTAVSIATASNAISFIQLVCIGTQSVVTSQKGLTTL
jgi:hypothetical protein